jgi:hypothetical protein
VTLDGCVPIVYRSRREAVAAAKEARLKGHAVALTRVETTARRWRVNGVMCRVLFLPYTGGWTWSVDEVKVSAFSAWCDTSVWCDTYSKAVEAAERCARGQR